MNSPLAAFLVGNTERLPLLKGGRWECEPLLAYVRSLPCCICRAYGSEANHLQAKGRQGNQASDLFAVPNCPTCHRKFHDMSVEEFEAATGVDLRLASVQTIQGFIDHLLAERYVPIMAPPTKRKKKSNFGPIVK